MKIEPTADARKQKNKREKRGRWQWWAKSCGARTVWLDAAAPSWQENAYSTMSAADREKRRLAAEAVDVATAVDRTIGALAALPDAVDGALS